MGELAIGQRFGRVGYASAAALLDAAQRGDGTALQITDALCRIMGRMHYNLLAKLAVQRISLGGSVF